MQQLFSSSFLVFVSNVPKTLLLLGFISLMSDALGNCTGIFRHLPDYRNFFTCWKVCWMDHYSSPGWTDDPCTEGQSLCWSVRVSSLPQTVFWMSPPPPTVLSVCFTLSYLEKLPIFTVNGSDKCQPWTVVNGILLACWLISAIISII